MASGSDHKGPGNDGSWFLEAIGALPAAPTPSETISALETENMLRQMTSVGTPPTAAAAFDGSTGTSTSTYEPVPREPGAQLGSPDHQSPPGPAAAPPRTDDTEMSAMLRTQRVFRRPAVAFGVSFVIVVAVAVVWLPAALQQDALAMRHGYAEASFSVREHLPTAQTALDAITDPATTPGALSSVVPIISELDSHAHILENLSDAPLPRQLPLLSSGAVDELEPLQDTARIQAARASDVARRLGYLYVYRTSIPQLLVTGDLPSEADTQTINALSVRLASSLVEASSIFSDLPNTASLASVNDAALGAVERYASWQDEYLMALSAGNEDAAVSLISEMDRRRSVLAEELNAVMNLLRIEVDNQIVELAADLDTFLTELSRQ